VVIFAIKAPAKTAARRLKIGDDIFKLSIGYLNPALNASGEGVSGVQGRVQSRISGGLAAGRLRPGAGGRIE
jgi:hypothetical protein